MFKKITIKTKLLIPMIVLTVILLFLGTLVITYSYLQMHSLAGLDTKITLSRYISATLHTLQKERGLSSGYLENNADKFKDELLRQRKESDVQIRRLLKEEAIAAELRTQNADLGKIREKIDKRRISSREIITYYTQVDAFLLRQVIEISKSSHVPKITQNITSYVNFLYLKEYGGIERAEGVVILSNKRVGRDALIRFTNLISMQDQHERMFLLYTCDTIREFYEKMRRDKSFNEVRKIQNDIVFGDIKRIKIDAKEWYWLITKKLNILEKVGRFIEKYTKIQIQNELENVKMIFYFISFLTVLSLLVFALMVIAFIKLAGEEQRLRTVTEKYIISSVTDLKGRIIDASEAFCKISGYSKAELLGKPHSITRHPDMPKEAFKNLWDTIQKGKTWKGKVKNRKKDGSFYWVYTNVEPLYNARGQIDSYISVRLDITESELLMQKIKEEEEKNRVARDMMYQQSRLAQMGEMLSMIAHQWRQPLSAITAAAAAIVLKAKLKKLDEQTAVELANKIKEFSQHLSSTIDDFRGFFRTNKTKESTNFKKIVDDVVNIVKSSLDNHDIILHVNVNSHKELMTYESELKQVVLNLIKNAEDALQEHKVATPIIVIEVNDEKLSIYDNAGGIPEDIIDKIFDPYFSTKRRKDGTGLGLYMSKTIVEEHCGGKLDVENGRWSDIEGVEMYGAKFTITLGDESD